MVSFSLVSPEIPGCSGPQKMTHPGSPETSLFDTPGPVGVVKVKVDNENNFQRKFPSQRDETSIILLVSTVGRKCVSTLWTPGLPIPTRTHCHPSVPTFYRRRGS